MAAVCWSWVGTLGVVPRDGCGGFCGWPWKTLTNALKNPDFISSFSFMENFNILKERKKEMIIFVFYFLKKDCRLLGEGYARWFGVRGGGGDWSASSFAGHGSFFFFPHFLERIFQIGCPFLVIIWWSGLNVDWLCAWCLYVCVCPLLAPRCSIHSLFTKEKERKKNKLPGSRAEWPWSHHRPFGFDSPIFPFFFFFPLLLLILVFCFYYYSFLGRC